MAYWIHTVDQDELKLLWSSLAQDLIAEELKDNPKDLTTEELQELGLKLTLKYQEDKGLDYDFSELVVKYGTEAMKQSYKEFTEAN